MPDRHQLLQKINEVSFAVNDLNLYLDTHPTDEKALSLFEKHSQERKALLQEYEKQFEPLTVDCVSVGSHSHSEDHCKYPGQLHFRWVDGPAPWEGGHI